MDLWYIYGISMDYLWNIYGISIDGLSYGKSMGKLKDGWKSMDNLWIIYG